MTAGSRTVVVTGVSEPKIVSFYGAYEVEVVGWTDNMGGEVIVVPSPERIFGLTSRSGFICDPAMRRRLSAVLK